MAVSYNRVILAGNTTRDIDIRYTPSGTSVADMGLAVNDRRKNASGETVEDTLFVDVTLWGRNAEIAAQYLKKGSPVLIEGRLKLDVWENAENEKRQKMKVVADRMQMLSRAPSDDSGEGKTEVPQQKPDDSGNKDDDGVPF